MFETEDIYLAAALVEGGKQVLRIVKAGSRARFEFDDSGALRDLVGDFYSARQTVVAHSYAERIRSAKSMAMNAPHGSRDAER